MANEFMDTPFEGGTTEAVNNEERKEITLKFAKGCVGEPFMGKDGKELVKIMIPNKDPEDKTPWASFVARKNQVHENQFGKGMWMKLPEDGYTTVRKDVEIEPDKDGKRQWNHTMKKVPNTELKAMVEFYKERESVMDKLSEKKKEAAKTPKKSRPAKEKQMAI